jgi:hypothetical protein
MEIHSHFLDAVLDLDGRRGLIILEIGTALWELLKWEVEARCGRVRC